MNWILCYFCCKAGYQLRRDVWRIFRATMWVIAASSLLYTFYICYVKYTKSLEREEARLGARYHLRTGGGEFPDSPIVIP